MATCRGELGCARSDVELTLVHRERVLLMKRRAKGQVSGRAGVMIASEGLYSSDVESFLVCAGGLRQSAELGQAHTSHAKVCDPL